MSEHCGFCFTVPCRCDTYLVSELEIAEWQESRGEYLNKYDARRLMATARSLRATSQRQAVEIEELRRALEFYAHPDSHTDKYGGWGENDGTPVNVDRGEKARAAMKEKP